MTPITRHSPRTEAAAVVAEDLSRTLRTWAAGSIAVGVAVAGLGQAAGNRQARAFGTQTALWGAIDAAIAELGRRRPPPTAPRLRTVLLGNAALDVGYMTVGALAAVRGAAWRDGQWATTARGHGTAVLIQGAFLLWLDTTRAARLR